ncbi:MAG: glycosyltransferase family 2 protein [Chloroflexi bacterium]|nr:glycosyltransferase family 2 protein [Chloroflexota bacterium]
MTSASPPTLTIGVPVYNREKYLRAAVESVLGQSFDDFELIISDNASTDGTEAIGRALAAIDPRVTYRRNATNLGLSGNLNVLVPLARGRLFKWATSDDLLRPGYLERCVAAIDADPGVVVVYPKTDFVDADGAPLDLEDPGWHLVSDDPSERLEFAILAGHFVNSILGVIRTDAMRRTRLMPRYPGGDYRFMAELALLGKFVEIPERLYIRRIHEGSSKGNADNISWLRRHYSGSRPGMRAAYWRLCTDHARTVLHAPISGKRKLVLLARLTHSMAYQRRRLLGELVELVRP